LEWLNRLELGFYYQKFIDNGYDTLDICSLIEESDLIEMEISKMGHKKSLLSACALLKDKKLPTKLSNDDKQKNTEAPPEEHTLSPSSHPATTDTSLPHPILNSPKPEPPTTSQKTSERTLPPKPQEPVKPPLNTSKGPQSDPKQKNPTPKTSVGLGFSPDLESSSSDTIYSETEEEDIFADK